MGTRGCLKGGISAALAFALALTSCSLSGPDPKRVQTPPPARYLPPGPPTPAIELGAAVNASWWKLFESPELDAVVTKALSASPTLESARQRLIAAREAVNAARSEWFPQINVSASVARERQSSTSFGLAPGSLPLPPNYNLFQIGPTVSYRPDVFGRTRQRIAQQVALAEAQHFQLAAAYLSLTGNTVREAIQIAAIGAQIEAVTDIVQIDLQTVDLVRKERDVGTVPDTDVVSAESQLATDETLRPGLEQQLAIAQHALAVLVGRTPAEWSPPPFELGKLTLPASVPVSLPSELVHTRPDILAAEADLRATSALVGLARAQFFPDITLTAGITASALSIRQVFDPSGLAWSIAAGLTQPVFDGGLRRAQRREALADFQASAADYQQTVLQAFAQVADLLDALTHDAELVAAQKRALDTAARSTALQRANYERGGAGLLELLDAQRQYQQALLGYRRAQAQSYLDVADLQVAIGAGGAAASP